MYTRSQIMFEIIKTTGLLYELRHGGPNKLMYAMARFNRATNRSKDVLLDVSPGEPEDLVLEYMEHVYNGAPEPRWLTQLERQ